MKSNSHLSAGLARRWAVSTWLGGGNGYVVTWYDQTGGNNQFTQTTQSRQPLLDLSNPAPGGLPAMKLDGIDDGMVVNYNIGTAYSAIIVNSPWAAGNGRTLQGTQNNWLLGLWNGFHGYFNNNGWVSRQVQQIAGMFRLDIALQDSNGGYYRSNGVDYTQSSAYTGGPGSGLALGGVGRYSEYSRSHICEVVVWNGILSNADLTTAESNIMTAWNL